MSDIPPHYTRAGRLLPLKFPPVRYPESQSLRARFGRWLSDLLTRR